MSRRRRSLIILAAVLMETLPLWLNGYRRGGDVVVRCRRGHLFTTIWIPGVSFKAVRLAWWRVQRCPVGGHWSIVTPVKESTLGEAEQRTALEHKDVRIP
jgi:hypothetical protein